MDNMNSPEDYLRRHGRQEHHDPHADDHAEAPGADGESALAITTAGWNEADLPPRKWIAQRYLLRGAITALIGQPGVSKSALALAYASALSFGEDCNGMKPTAPVKVLLMNAEDDHHEQQRRLSGTLRLMGRAPAEIAGRIILATPVQTALLFDRHPETGRIVETSAWHELMKAIDHHKPDALVLDPFAEIHSEDENSNIPMRGVMAKLRSLAVAKNLAILIVHHTRKGATAAGDPDVARGASSIIGAVRIALTVTAMTADEANSFGLPAGAHRGYFRVDGAKANYSALTDCEWFERHSIQLDNGDWIAVPRPWDPPVSAIVPETMLAIERSVAKGSSIGPWSPRMSRSEPRSIQHLLLDHGLVTKAAQQVALNQLQHAGFIVASFHDARRRVAQGYRSPDGLPPAPWISASEASEGGEAA